MNFRKRNKEAGSSSRNRWSLLDELIHFIRYLKENQCHPFREGGSHTIILNDVNKKISALLRHKEIKDNLVRKICKDLEIPAPENFQ